MPDHWKLTTLGEAADVEMGQSPPGDTYNSHGDGLPFLQGSAEFGGRFPSPDRWCSAPTRVAEPGDLLVSVRAPVGDTNFADTRLAIGRGLARVRTTPVASADFLRLVIQAEVGRLNKSAGSGMFASITAKNLRGFRVALPPVREQQRIVDLIGSIENNIDCLQTQVEATRAALSAVLSDLLSSPGDEWQETTLGELADWFSGGTPKSTNETYYRNGTIRWAIIADLLNDPIVETAKRISEAGLAAIGGRLAPAGSVLVSMYGTIARTAVAGVPLATNQAIAWAEPHADVCDSAFLRLLIDQLRPEFERAARGAAQKNINRGMIRNAGVTLPPPEVQRRILDLTSAFEDQIARLQSQFAAAQNVRAVVLSELLSGERLLDESYDAAVSP